MKRYNLYPVRQKHNSFYVLVADPRVIVEMLPAYEAGEEQEAQRPWDKGRVKDIATYVAGKFKDDDNKRAIGLIPNAPILNIKNTIELQHDTAGTYIMLPEYGDDIAPYMGCIEAIDGQHRIRAFMEEYIDVDFPEDMPYEMLFSVFFRLSQNEKKEIFMITNEKQVKVPGNLLRMFKRELDLLKGDEVVFDLVCTLNDEDYSPLKNRIMVGAKKIRKGYQESQISKVLNKSDSYHQLSVLLDGPELDTMAKIISNYLIAWERVYTVSFQDPRKETITKISGLRYIFYLFPTVLDILGQRQKPATVDEFKKIIVMLPAATGLEDVFADPSTTLSFRGEGATIQLAKEHYALLKSYEQKHKNNFNIAEGI